MREITRRMSLGLISMGVAGVVCGPQTVFAGKKKPLSPATIETSNFQGKATIEFVVGDVGQLLTSRATTTEESLPLQIAPKGKSTLEVVISWQTATRLKRLGIADPAKHLRGKRIRISGTVERRFNTFGGVFYRVDVTSLSQLLDVRKP